MNTIEEYIDFKKITFDKFEELCFELLLKHGFSKLIWRKGGADNGRDIEGQIIINNSLIGQYNEYFFFECKKYENAISPEKLNSKIAWADAEKPDHLVFLISSYASNNCRIWLNKIQNDKSYKIHVIEGEELKRLISQHDDLVSKYFIENKYLNLLYDTINKWIIHNLTPNFYTYYYLLENLNISELNIKHQVFLYTLYYTFYSKLEELENENYHGIDILEDLNELLNNIKANSNTEIPVLNIEFKIDALSDEGYLNYETGIDYDFIASEVAIFYSHVENCKITYYLFKRINKNEAIEILLYQNSDLDFKIRYIVNYNFEHYKEVVHLISYKPKFAEKVINISSNMK
ncbi:restriction endonuclease [Kordia sp.]|uniref:restriction endonuclease n=1 Tax=Kordia sp. TaxID=1965332 RepID=UPI003D271067